MGIVLQLALMAMRLRAQQSAGRAVATSGIVLLAALFALFGLAGFTAAAWIGLAHQLDAIRAALIMGGVGFVVAAILVVIAKSRRRRRILSPATSQLPDVSALLIQNIGKGSNAVIWTPLIGVALLGLLIGRGGKRD